MHYSVASSKREDLGFCIDQLGFALLALASLGYLLYAQRFAEWHIQVSFLNFPIFTGEIVLFVCLLLTALKWLLQPPQWERWYGIFAVYMLFVVIKALWGFKAWGPLALRDSAMMYYPLFAVLACSFYRREFFQNKVMLLSALLSLLVLKFFWVYEYSVLALLIIACVLILSYPDIKIRRVLWLLLLLAIPYEKFFHGSRTMLIGLMGSLVFCFTALFFILPIRARYKVLIVCVISGLFFTLVKTKFDPHKLKAMLDVDSVTELFKMQNNQIAYRKANFMPVQKDVQELRLYNPEGVHNPGNYALEYEEYDDPQWSSEFESAVGNITFRLHIWQDMIEQMLAQKPFLGFDFGKPLRSPRIEMLGIAVEVWNRDGWIGAHNSFLYFIYRAGIVGVFLVLGLWGGVLYLSRLAINARSVVGVLLCSSLVFWLVAANFLLIFELPYNAIPFWILAGVTVAVLRRSADPQAVAWDQEKKEMFIRLIDRAGIGLLLLCTFGYMVNARRFAEAFVQFPFLDFPVFVGEVTISLCLLLMLAKWQLRPLVWRNAYIVPLVFAVFVIIKALVGYKAWGALALRDSALLYYPICALFGYIFFDPKMFDKRILLLGTVVLLVVLKFFWIYEYFLLMSVIVALLLIRAYPHQAVKNTLFILLALAIPYKDFFGSRTMLLGLVASGVFCLGAFSYILPVKSRYKVLMAVIFALFIFFGVQQYADVHRMRTLLNLAYYKNMLMVFEEAKERKKNYVPKEIKTLRLYNPEPDNAAAPTKVAVIPAKVPVVIAPAQEPSKTEDLIGEPVSSPDSARPAVASVRQGTSAQKDRPDVHALPIVPSAAIVPPPKPKDPELSSVYGNITFRVLIWRDMIDQLVESKPWLGFDFGKPLRSPSIEMSHIAFDEWQRDGWIGAHNSFLHILYRAGIVGVVFIGLLFIMLSRLILVALKMRSVAGVLCCAVLIFWFVSANFLLILELPYNAIPIWALFGMTAAYLTYVKEKAI